MGDSTRTGAPGGASARSAVVSALWPPAVISTSAAVTPAGPPISRANQARSSGSPSTGGRPQAPGRRPARARAAARARSGWRRGVQIAAVELDDAGRRGGERDQDPGGVDASAVRRSAGAVRAERDLLPGGVTRPRAARGARPRPGRRRRRAG